MKKTISFGIIALLLIGLSSAIYFNSKQEALNYKQEQITNRAHDLAQVPTIFKDKELNCVYLHIDDTIPKCFVYYNFSYAGEMIRSRTTVLENATETEVNSIIKEDIKEYIKRQYDKIRIEYTATTFKSNAVN